jgi:hypothetical protein
MADNYKVQVIAQALTGTTTDITKTITADDTCTQMFWGEVSVPAGASNVDVGLGELDDPKILVVKGGSDCVFRLDSTGTDRIRCDPIAIVSDEDNGLGIDQILIDNNDSVSHVVTIFCAQ